MFGSRASTRAFGVLSIALIACGACGDDEPSPMDAGGDATSPPQQDGALPDADAPVDANLSEASPVWDGAIDIDLPDGPLCVLRVGAECDGAEDCGSGEVCCAEFSPERVSYERIACEPASTCRISENRFPLCHAGERCTLDDTLTCRQSFILPFPFLGVCAPPNNRMGPPTGAAVSGEVACGEEICEVGVERCCLRASFNLRTQSGGPLEPTCVGLDETCDCETEVGIGPPDEVDGGDDDDAG